MPGHFVFEGSAASLNRPIAFDGGYHSSRLGARNVRLGLSLPKWVAGAMSVPLPIATEERTSREVRKVPLPDSSCTHSKQHHGSIIS
jgi:hypothetical protein